MNSPCLERRILYWEIKFGELSCVLFTESTSRWRCWLMAPVCLPPQSCWDYTTRPINMFTAEGCNAQKCDLGDNKINQNVCSFTPKLLVLSGQLMLTAKLSLWGVVHKPPPDILNGVSLFLDFCVILINYQYSLLYSGIIVIIYWPTSPKNHLVRQTRIYHQITGAWAGTPNTQWDQSCGNVS